MKLEHPEYFKKIIYNKNKFIQNIVDYHAQQLNTDEKLYLRDLIEIDFWTDEKIIENYEELF